MISACRFTFLFVALALTCITARGQEYPLPPKEWPSPIEDRRVYSQVLVDRLEYRKRAGADGQLWDLQGWVGGDYNRLWLKSEGERTIGGGTERADLQALYARLIKPYWYIQAGVRAETNPRPSRTQGVLALQGIAPYWFNIEASAFVSEKGKLSGRFEAERDFLFSQRLILQPRFEAEFSGSSESERLIGRGVTNLEYGVRLRYEIKREFAPYVGISWSRKPGETGDLMRAAGKDTRETAIVLGLRVWY